MKVIVLAAMVAGTTWCAGPILTSPQVQAAILQGTMYKTADQFLETGLKGRRVKLASAMAMDGVSKYATFFNDWGAIVAASAAANQQMRKLSSDEVRINGLLHAFVEIHGRGASGVGKLDRRYAQGRAHLVLQLGAGRIVQPVDKNMIYRSGQSGPMYLMGIPSGRITLDFAFDVEPQDLLQPVMVILIDGDGHKHQAKADLQGALNFGSEE